MVLGITGGIGSGKSTAADIIKNEYGFRLIDTDSLARQIMTEDDDCKERLKKQFGPEIYLPDGTIAKEQYKKVIYSSDENRKLSDSIIHPLVWKKVSEIIAESPEQNYLVETAIPGDSFRQICDRILFVDVDRDVRLERLMRDRGYSLEYAEAVLSKQKNQKEFLNLADAMIDNSFGREELMDNVKKAVDSL